MLGLLQLDKWRAERRKARRLAKFEQAQKRYASLDVQSAFERIYEEAEWGEGPDGARFWSGNGSHPDHSRGYEDFVVGLIERNAWIGTLLDVGCGDFQVSRRILERTGPIRYTGVDVVRPLIEHHTDAFGAIDRRFLVCNAAEEALPMADLGFIRQILQHLSNAQVSAVLQNAARSVKAAVITESVPIVAVAPNLDIHHGVTTRVALGSGIYVDQPPFSLDVVDCFDLPHTRTEILRVSLVRFGPTVDISLSPHPSHAFAAEGRAS